MAETTKYARAAWTAGDVQTFFPGLTDEQAGAFLARNEGKIQDAMVEAGWAAIEQLGVADGFTPAEDDEDEVDERPEKAGP